MLALAATGACDAPSERTDASAADGAPAAVRDVAGWTAAEIEVLRSLSLERLPALGPDPSNRFAEAPAAAALGHRLFFDPALGRGGAVSCASCHRPELHFTDGLRRSMGLARATRNAPTVVGAAYSPWQFWDGRRDSLWSQALAPLEAQAEMGTTRVEVARLVAGPRYADAYRAAFGSLPDLPDEARLPARAGPFAEPEARTAWDALAAEDRERVSRVFANVGKAIAAYECLLRPGATRFDRHVGWLVAGAVGPDPAALTPDEIAGARLFIDPARTQCMRCHNGPLLTNHAFHDVGSGPGEGFPDFGRYLGAQALLLDEFNCLGPWSDAAPEDCKELRFLNRAEIGAQNGAFKTPGLRGVAETAPYFHDGRFATLEEVLAHYVSPPDREGHELLPLDLDAAAVAQLVAFLRTLSAPVDADTRWLSPPGGQ